MIESLTGFETIRSQGAEGVTQAKWERTNWFLASATVRMRSLSSGAMYGTNYLTQLASVGLILIGVHLIAQRELTMGALIAVTTLSSRALAPAGQIVGLLMQYQGARTAMDSLNAIMEKPVERPTESSFVQRHKLTGDIEFRNVKFAYPNRTDAALDGLSFKIAAGEKVALIGRVSSGKSTIQRLIMGLYQPQESAVLLLAAERVENAAQCPDHDPKAWAWRARCCTTRRSCCWTNPPARWIFPAKHRSRTR